MQIPSQSAADQTSCNWQMLEKNGNIMDQHISYLQILRKPMIHF